MDPRERLEFRAERAIVRLTPALMGLLLAIMAQAGTWIWFASYYVANQQHLERQLNKLDTKVDSLLADGVTPGDLAPMRALISDHESRLRAIERAPR